MSTKLVNISFLILFGFFAPGQAASTGQFQPDSVAIDQLKNSVHNFEAIFYGSDTVDSTEFIEGIHYFDSLIKVYILLDSRHPGQNFDRLAFINLEKKKNIKILNLYKNLSHLAIDINKDQIHSDFSLKIDFNKISTTGQNLLDLMTRPIDIADLQRNFLNDYDAILDYWIQENQIFVFILTRDSLKIVNWAAPIDEIKSGIDKIIAPFYGEIDLLKLKFNTEISFQLYNYLFQPLVNQIQERQVLYIIPDDFLVGFPFELLVADTTISGKANSKIYYHHFNYLNFLIKKYAFSYNYSTAYFALIKGFDRTTKKLGRRLLTMSEPAIATRSTGIADKARTGLPTGTMVSNYSEDEIKRVSRLLFRHDNLKKQQVTKTYLIENGRNYRWIYFALPGILDNIHPQNSGLLFSADDQDSVNRPNWLSVTESMHLDLSADLLSLSSTQVNIFNVDEHRGVIALPQAFLFSGVRSVLFSLWQIHSISTSQFMSKFYWELKYKRQTNARALQEAKNASMKDTFTFSGKKISRAHPYFWATFHLIGDPQIRPPSPTKIPPGGVIIIVYVIVFVVSLYITKKTLPNRK